MKDNLENTTTSEPRAFLNHPETVAFYIGLFEAFSSFEKAQWQESPETDCQIGEAVRQASFIFWKQPHMERWLEFLSALDPIFSEQLGDPAAADARCFTNTLSRLVALKQRLNGPFGNGVPIGDLPLGSGKQALSFSPSELRLNFLSAFTIFATIEMVYRSKGEAIPETIELLIRNWCNKQDIERWLSAFDEHDPLLEVPLEARLQNDPWYFTRVFYRLHDLRAENGREVWPCEVGGEIINDDYTKASAHYLSLENFSRITGVVLVLGEVEKATRTGSIDCDTAKQLISILDKECELDNQLQVFLGELTEKVTLDGLNGSLAERFDKERDGVRRTYIRLLAAHEEIFAICAPAVVDEVFKRYTFEDTKRQIQAILNTLRRRLHARQEAVERFEYNRLETIDKNCEHLLTTLKQYGIDAKSYDEALRAYEVRFGTSTAAAKKSIEEEIEAELLHKVSLKEIERRLSQKHPDDVEYIQRQIRKRMQS